MEPLRQSTDELPDTPVVMSAGEAAPERRLTPEEITSIARGLGRSTLVSRQANGLPITARAHQLEQLMGQSQQSTGLSAEI